MRGLSARGRPTRYRVVVLTRSPPGLVMLGVDPPLPRGGTDSSTTWARDAGRGPTRYRAVVLTPRPSGLVMLGVDPLATAWWY